MAGCPKKSEKIWGEPPKDLMAVNGEILVPGIHNGNLFIGLQPPRALEEKAEEAYHSTDIVCPHQYIAFCRYLREVFGAHAIVHVGTHGTLEWLVAALDEDTNSNFVKKHIEADIDAFMQDGMDREQAFELPASAFLAARQAHTEQV